MKASYRNKRDQYKAEAQENLRRALAAEKKLAGLQPKKEGVEYYSDYVYCTNCQYVLSVRIPVGRSIRESDCANCRVIGGVYPVKKNSWIR